MIEARSKKFYDAITLLTLFYLEKRNTNMTKVIHTENAPAAIGPYVQAVDIRTNSS